MRHRSPRARAQARAAAFPWLAWAAFAALLLAGSVAWGQVPTNPGRNGNAEAPAAAGPVSGDAQAGSSGVIRPPTQVDPAMRRSTPSQQAFPMPVVPPPGTPGGNPNVIAK